MRLLAQDLDEPAVGFQGEIIHCYNKNEHSLGSGERLWPVAAAANSASVLVCALYAASWTLDVKARTHALLAGDSLGAESGRATHPPCPSTHCMLRMSVFVA